MSRQSQSALRRQRTELRRTLYSVEGAANHSRLCFRKIAQFESSVQLASTGVDQHEGQRVRSWSKPSGNEQILRLGRSRHADPARIGIESKVPQGVIGVLEGIAPRIEHNQGSVVVRQTARRSREYAVQVQRDAFDVECIVH